MTDSIDEAAARALECMAYEVCLDTSGHDDRCPAFHRPAVAAEMRALVEREREACAVIAANYADSWFCRAGNTIASAIRARGEETNE